MTKTMRLCVRLAAAGVLAGAPLLAMTGTAAADTGPAPLTGTAATVTMPGLHQVGYDEWYFRHCTIDREWWRPACHPNWAPPPPPQAPAPLLPPTGSA